MPLINIIGCLDAYLYFICKSNFKLCDMTSNYKLIILADVTFDMCQSVCQTFQNTCQTNSAICQSLSSSVKFHYNNFSNFQLVQLVFLKLFI